MVWQTVFLSDMVDSVRYVEWSPINQLPVVEYYILLHFSFYIFYSLLPNINMSNHLSYALVQHYHMLSTVLTRHGTHRLPSVYAHLGSCHRLLHYCSHIFMRWAHSASTWKGMNKNLFNHPLESSFLQCSRLWSNYVSSHIFFHGLTPCFIHDQFW